MDLNVSEVATLLGVTKDKVRELQDQGVLRAHKMGDDLKFDPLEIEQWVMHRDDSEDSSSVPSVNISTGNQQFGLYRAVFRGGVRLNVKGATKEEVISHVSKELAPSLELDPRVIEEMLLNRESLAPTAINSGLAVPHTREIVLKRSFNHIAVVFPKEPIAYGALDGKAVHTMLFLFASDSKMHLHLLSKIAHLANDEKALELLQKKPSLSELLSFLKVWEKKLSKQLEEN